MKKYRFRLIGIVYIVEFVLWSYLNVITPCKGITCFIDWVSGTVITAIFAATYMWIDRRISHFEFYTLEETDTLQIAQYLGYCYALFPVFLLIIAQVVSFVGGIFTSNSLWLTRPLLSIIGYIVLVNCLILNIMSIKLMLDIIKPKEQKFKEKYIIN
jgi:hypothetical protein